MADISLPQRNDNSGQFGNWPGCDLSSGQKRFVFPNLQRGLLLQETASCNQCSSVDFVTHSLLRKTRDRTVINYRSLKKLLGENSLERKCRLLFGLALLLLISTSFWIYAGRTRQLVERQQVVKAQALVPEILLRRHMEWLTHKYFTEAAQQAAAESADESRSAQIASQIAKWAAQEEKVKAVEEFRLGAAWDLILEGESPSDDYGHEALLAFRDEENNRVAYLC